MSGNEARGAGAGDHPASADGDDAGRGTVADIGYEAARDELVEVVRALEGGGTTLEESLELWERGEALATRCQGLLDGVRARLDAVRVDGAGEPAADTTGEPPREAAGGRGDGRG